MPKKNKKKKTKVVKTTLPAYTKDQGRFAFVNLQKYALIFSILLLLGLFLWFISPFFAVIIIAAVIAVDLAPFNQWLTTKVRFKSVASVLTTLLVLLVGITPLALFITFVATEAVAAVKDIALGVDAGTLDLASILPERLVATEFGQGLQASLSQFTFSADEFVTIINDSLSSITSIGTELFTQTTNILKQVGLFALFAVMFVICLFYFLYEGDKLSTKLKALLPMPTKYKDPLFSRLNALSKGIIYGIFGAAVVQGVFGGIGFYIAGIDNAAFWGTMMAIFSPVPYIGPAIVWMPMVVYLLINGAYLPAIFVGLWGSLVVSTVDNLVKPYLIGKSTAINPLLVLLTLIGGVILVGVKALVFAPFLLTVLLSLLHIYELEYKKVLDE
jgi:predicted PurR-regulated permease PerM